MPPVDRLARAFAEVHRALDGLDWWLSDGAALGAVRDGRIVGGDIDVGVWEPDLDKVAAALPVPSVRHRCEVKATFDGQKVDVHGHLRTGELVWYPLGKSESVVYEFPARLFAEFERYEVYGLPVWVPCPVESYLAAHYGADWRTPRPGWSWQTSPPCARWNR